MTTKPGFPTRPFDRPLPGRLLAALCLTLALAACGGGVDENQPQPQVTEQVSALGQVVPRSPSGWYSTDETTHLDCGQYGPFADVRRLGTVWGGPLAGLDPAYYGHVDREPVVVHQSSDPYPAYAASWHYAPAAVSTYSGITGVADVGSFPNPGPLQGSTTIPVTQAFCGFDILELPDYACDTLGLTRKSFALSGPGAHSDPLTVPCAVEFVGHGALGPLQVNSEWATQPWWNYGYTIYTWTLEPLTYQWVGSDFGAYDYRVVASGQVAGCRFTTQGTWHPEPYPQFQ